MNLTQLIIKQARLFPNIKKEQLYRLVNSYERTSRAKFDIEFTFLVRVNILKLSYDRFEGIVYKL